MDYSEKQSQILEVAERLFAEQGFDGTSVRDIAKGADVNVAMISYYFGSKEKLLEAIFIKRAEFVKIKIETMLEKTSLTPLQKVYEVIDTFVERIMSQQNFHKLMVCLQVTERGNVISDAIYQSKVRNHQLVKDLILEGQKKGDFKKNIDVGLMMSTLIGTANQVISSQQFYRDMSNMKNIPDEEFQKTLKKRLTVHIKTLFKSILTYEA